MLPTISNIFGIVKKQYPTSKKEFSYENIAGIQIPELNVTVGIIIFTMVVLNHNDNTMFQCDSITALIEHLKGLE